MWSRYLLEPAHGSQAGQFVCPFGRQKLISVASKNEDAHGQCKPSPRAGHSEMDAHDVDEFPDACSNPFVGGICSIPGARGDR